MTLKRRYHCVPSSNSTMEPIPRATAKPDQPQQDNREQSRGGHRGRNLGDGLSDRRQFWAQSDEHSDRNAPERSEQENQLDAQERGAGAQRRCPRSRTRDLTEQNNHSRSLIMVLFVDSGSGNCEKGPSQTKALGAWVWRQRDSPDITTKLPRMPECEASLGSSGCRPKARTSPTDQPSYGS
jgi:hypothetical protein